MNSSANHKSQVEQIMQALEQCHQHMLAAKRARGQDLIVWLHGKAQRIKP
jgi:hypothetical protein